MVQNLATMEMIKYLKDKIDSINDTNSIVIRTDNTSPAQKYGGTWQRIEGKFLLGTGGGTP